MAMKTWCPRCNQGWVFDSRVRATGQLVRVCEECEALWSDKVPVAESNFEDMATYLRSIGLKGEWSEIDTLPET
jgi:uncharacterized protein (DUF983 family)